MFDKPTYNNPYKPALGGMIPHKYIMYAMYVVIFLLMIAIIVLYILYDHDHKLLQQYPLAVVKVVQ